ncbi:amino acid adenylation domain-containing protein [Nocardia jiangsuensis]|uniref:Amino acid adenylation domain-containing protein n=1 Tax=Nocardia jiangsuensis TaxID=1691563 RepID=A0ABV8DSU7_9NOCA
MSSLATERVDQCASPCDSRDGVEPFPLSPAQSALYYAQRLRPDVPLIIAQYVELRGELDLGRLHYAIERCGAEAEVGRVRLIEEDGVPYQVVDPEVGPEWLRLDLRGEPDPRTAAFRWMTEHAASPVDIERDPLSTNAVLRIGDTHHLWYVRAHHILVDGYGAMNVLTRAAEIYTAATDGTEPTVSRAAPLTEIYENQSRYRDSTRFLADREHWRAQLAGTGEPVSLDGSPLAEVPDAPGRHLTTAVLDEPTAAALAAAGTAHDAKTAVLFVAAAACYAHAVTGRADVLLSLPVSGRTTMALRRSAGVVSNVVPLRIEFTPETTLADVVRAAELQVTAALRHQLYRHDDIRRDGGYSRAARGFFGPMVNIMLFKNELRLGDMLGSMHVLATGPVEDLSINVYNGIDGEIHLDFEANPARYRAAEVTAQHTRFRDFLARFLAARPETGADALSALTADERHRVLYGWNDTAMPLRPGTLAELFDGAVAGSPAAPALEFDDELLSYAELDRRANRLARFLIARGAGPERVVALAVRRSVELVVGMYAAMKAGAAYLPLDPDHPAERLAGILEQAEPVAVLTTERDEVPLPAGVARFALDTIDLSAESAAPVTDRDRRSPLRPDNPAYLLFTSGSTGRPKGVTVTHAAIVNRLRWMQHEYPMDHTDAVLQKTPATFDVSVWEFFWPLQVGARLVIAAPDGHRDPDYLARTIAERSVTTAHFVPSMLSVFVTDTDVRGCAGLRRVFCSGEALPAATVRAFQAALPRVRLHNLYGPTEAAVDVTAWTCPPNPASVPIGSPVWNTRTYVLDARLRPVPPGVSGELYLAGVQLARGYLGRPQLTADRFVADPFTAGQRLYRTGDLARWRADGALEYLGRSDFQVKIRGQRIELGEIEAALLADERVARAVCVAHTGRVGAELVGYVVAAPGASRPLDRDALLAGVRALLPAYMVPAQLVELDELPLSANGKIDRKALPAPAAPARSAGGTRPRTEVERAVAKIVAELLELDDIAVTESFFALGGNSLIAARAIARINALLGTGLTIRDLFEADTVAALAERCAGHADERTAPVLAAGPRPEHVPLSPAQQRLWILNRIDEQAAAYNMPLALRIDGPLDVTALRAGLRDVLERHESLRTTFPETPAGPAQRVHPAADIPLTLDPVPAPAAQVPALIGEFTGYGFDLREQAPIRVALWRTGPDTHIFVAVLHHICGDGWSLAPLTRDLTVAVSARAAGRAPAWTPLPVQYADFALWQRALLGDESDSGSALSRQLTHWRGALDGLPDQLDLPLDRPRPRRRGTEGGRVPFTVPTETRAAAAALAAERGVSMFMVLHAALATLLARICATRDIAVGTPIAGRSDPQLDELVGMFVNTLVLRTAVDPAAGFDRVLDHARDTDLNAFANADVPFERLVELVNPERSTARHPLFQVMLAYDNGPDLTVQLPGVRTERIDLDADVAKFDLRLEVHDGGEDAPLTGEFGYAADIFDHATVAAVARRFVAVLTAAVADPARPVGDIDLLDLRETGRFLPLAGGPAEPVVTLSGLFGAVAERAPESIALRYRGTSLSYGELEARANRLARVLAGHGAGPEMVVAVAIPRSPEAIVAIWAVAKTGAAYVPVDPRYPSDRIEHMLTDSEAALGLTVARSVDGLPRRTLAVQGRHHRAEMEWLVLDSAELDRACASAAPRPLTDAERERPLRGAHPAYLIYTSGSTGKPKAVVVTHAGIASLAAEQRYLFGVTDRSRTLHFSSPSFDASVLELLLGFAAGATIAIAPDDVYGGAELARLLRDERVTHAFVTPAALATVPTAEPFADLGTVIVGGEAVSADLVRTWGARYRMHNMYGPSEATVAATASAPMVPGAPVPLGAPVRGMRLFVLDGRLRPVPPGTPGELYLSGPGVARGYLGKLGLTAARFPANPHGRRGERMYRTGDLVVADRTGALRFLGRADDQIKIRGFRVELSEIDHALRAQPGVTAAVTVPHTDPAGHTRLAAYVTGADHLTPADVLSGVRGRLPGYMVPASLLVLDRMPVTGAGKLDRRALPNPVFDAAAGSRAPRTETERRVAALFGEVLGQPVTGAEDGFFEIGGTSLLATRLVAALHDEFGVELPVRAIFEAPTVADIAAALAVSPRTERVRVTAGERPERIPLALPQQRLWFLNRLDPANSAYNIAVALHISGELDVAALRSALGDLVERHEVLRTVFPEDAHGPVQRILPTVAATPALPVLENAADAEHATQALTALAQRGFDLATEPPLRVALVRTAPDEHVLAVVLHHIAADGASLTPLTRDLGAAYLARAAGTPPNWAPLPVQYADFGLWQRERFGAVDDPASPAATQLAHWRAALADLPDELPLPYDRPRPAEPTQRAGTVRIPLPAGLRAALERLARDRGVSPFMVLRSALAVLLRGLTGGRDVVIGTPVAGRSAPELHDLVGMFVNTVVLRSDVDPDAAFTELLAADLDSELAAMEHADLPFDLLVAELGAEVRGTGRHPLFQVALTVQDEPHPGLALPGLTVTARALDIARAKFDLELRAPAGLGDELELVYAAELFDVGTVETVGHRLLTVLAAVAADPERPVHRIDLRTDWERAVLSPAHGGPAAAPVTLAEYFERTADEHPHRIAVRSAGTVLDYFELAERVNRLARMLRARGIGAGDRVALGLTRSIDSVAAALAVVTAGAAYVPLDPAYPADRLRHMLADSGCRVGLTRSAHAAALAAADGGGTRWLLLDDKELTAELAAHSARPLAAAERARPARPDDLAYVIYTSGSTGTPKGVAVTHTGLAGLAEEFGARAQVTPDSRTLHFSTPSFDAAMLDLLLTINAGAAMVLCPTDVFGGDELGALLAAERVTHLFLTPAALATVDHERWPLPALRSLMVGGEAVGAELVARWAPGRRMFDVYGPTETTVVATISRPLTVGGPIDIGTPVRGARALVLDDRLRPVPVGVPGELYLGGYGVARGYLDRYGLTAARFVADPTEPGARLYRTGDVVRWTADGALRYLGRSDHQVKMRGFRIELGEITGALSAHPSVRFAHTEVRRIAGADRIAAFVHPADPAAGIDVEALRTHVARVLPTHMVPSALTVLDEIPLTPVGKLDIARLPEPQPLPGTGSGRAAETQAERLVAATMAELLGVQTVHADDGFFDIGGNSLLATRLVARLAEQTGVRLEVRTVFAEPTVAALATRIDRAEPSTRVSRPVAVRRPAHIPLSAAQRRLWFLDRFEESGSRGAYNVPLVLRLRGSLDLEALASALVAVQERHETLRTVFPEHEGEPVQRILDAATTTVPVAFDSVRPAEVVEAISRFTAPGFDLATEVPVRAALLHVSSGGPIEDYVLAVVVHHIAVDGWSLGPLAADIAIAYRAARLHAAPEWEPLPLQYADYTLWQRDALGAEDDPAAPAHRQLTYWRETLAELPELLALPADRPRPPVPSHRGGTAEAGVDAFTHRELRRIADRANASMFMLLHAALAVLLHRMAGTGDVTVGTPHAGRGDRELDGLIGMFVNTLVLRTAVSPELRFGELLARVRETDLDAFDHADLPFERLVEVLNPARSRSHHPLFQVMLSVRNEPVGPLELPGLQIEPLDLDAGIAKFDLQFTLTEHGGADPGGITVGVNYAADLFDHNSALGLGERLVRLLTAIAANPASAVGDLDLLHPAEWSGLAPVHGAEPDRPLTFPDVFATAVAAEPDAIALRADGTDVTYEALDRWSSRLARLLIRRGVGPETLVALGIARSVESVATVLAVVKTGAAFVPVDPRYPAARIAHMLADSGAALGLTLAAHRDTLPNTVDWLVLDDPDTRAGVLASEDSPLAEAERPAPLRLENPAYVIYTSGSTGTPKGVVVTHGGLSNFAAELAERFDVRPGSRVLHFATPSFDAAMLDLLFALGGGATLVIAPPEVVGGDGLREVFVGERITHAFITTAALGTVDPGGVVDLAHILVGGEALPPDLVNRWAPGRNLYNVYGPTETTIVTVISQPMAPGAPITIGGPIRGVAATILDSRLHPAPVGVTGELQLAGAALARGYLNRPGLTAQRFVANPYGKPGERMYRTGDLVRWRETGAPELPGRRSGREIEYVGRSDHQVKIRGFRIELGEIDAALASQGEVDYSLTIGHRTEAGATALVSYVKPRAGTAPTAAQLTAHVAGKVPNYMVPQAIMLLDELPLTPVGKLDRARLPEPVFAGAHGYRAPLGPLETAIAAAFAEVLGIQRVGADDGFFELGGNSLLATRVVGLLRAAGIEVAVQQMFGAASPAAIAASLSGGASIDPLAPVLPIRTTGDAAPLFCVHPAIGLSWCYSGLLAHLDTDRPVYGLQAPHVTGDEPFESISQAANRYIEHIRSVQPHGPYHLLGWSLGGLIAHAVATRLQQQGEEVALLGLLDSYRLSDDLLELAMPSVAEIVAEFGGIAADDLDPELDLAGAAALLREENGPFAALTGEHLERLYEGYRAGTVLAHGFRPRVFDGDLLFFTAAEDEINRADPNRSAAAWRPFVAGAIHDHALPCRHADMTTPEALAVIGPVLRSRLGGGGGTGETMSARAEVRR